MKYKIIVNTVKDLKDILENYPDDTSLLFNTEITTFTEVCVTESTEIGSREYENIPVLAFTNIKKKLNDVHFKKPKSK